MRGGFALGLKLCAGQGHNCAKAQLRGGFALGLKPVCCVAGQGHNCARAQLRGGFALGAETVCAVLQGKGKQITYWLNGEEEVAADSLLNHGLL